MKNLLIALAMFLEIEAFASVKGSVGFQIGY